MDAGDLYRASSSLRASSKRGESFRANSSSLWRNTGLEVFNRSSHEEDDEEALKWAALEKLPTFDRLRRGLLLGSRGANEIEVLGLEMCADNWILISGVEKITGEMLVGPAKALFMDEISTGLDSSTTFQIVNMLRQYVHIMKGTAFISLLQPAPETYNLFDDIVLLSDGQIVYQGPRENVLDFFESMGFKCPTRKGVADFGTPPLANLQRRSSRMSLGGGLGMSLQLHLIRPKATLLLLLVHQSASALFRFIGSAGRNMIVANTFGLFALLLLFALGGFVLSREDVKKWWLWGYWSSPLMYAQNAILVNEFTGHSWSKIVNGTKLGVLVMESRGFFPQTYWYWIGLTSLFGFIWLFNIFYLLCLTFLDVYEKPQAVLPETVVDDSHNQASAQDRELVRRSISSGSSSVRSDAIEATENRKRGMILPFEPHSITFDDIRYSVDMPAEMKDQGATDDKLELLKGVSGAFRPGVLTALMGVSGAGKTTLMDVLAGRKTGGYIEGDITISGYPKNQATFARISGYCEQNDIHSPNVTVYESLVYSAWLRLPQEVDADTKKVFVDEVMDLVELTPLRSALVGLPGVSGLSTEQRKRLTIAVELVANPSIIFMDEPTSGLDARAAAIVMRTVRNTVNTGRTVVCTIHQPSIDIFEAFDELFLMKRGGEEIYVGPLGRHSTHLIKYFEAIEGVPKIKDGINPATWMLEVTTTAQELAIGIEFADSYKKSELYTRNKALIKELSVPRPGTKDLYFTSKYSQSFLTQCFACLWKQHWSYWRNPPYTAVRFSFTTFIALIFGSMFWDLGSKRKTQQDLFNAMGSMYAAINFLGFQYGSTVQPVVAIERTVFYRERAAGMYSALPYAFSQFMIEIPYVFVQSLIYGLIVFSMMGFPWSVQKFAWFIYFLFFSLLYFVLYGMMTVAVTPNHNIAAIISSFFYGIWNLFSGFIIPRPRMPIWWRWYYWATPVSYTLYGFITSQYGDIKETMDNDMTVEEFLESYFGFRHDMLGVVAAILVGVVVVFTFIFAYSIKTFNFQRR